MKAFMLGLTLAITIGCGQSCDAAMMSFFGEVTGGVSGVPPLGTLPRAFKLDLFFTDSLSASTPATGVVTFPATGPGHPGGVQPLVSSAVAGPIAVVNNSAGFGGNDIMNVALTTGAAISGGGIGSGTIQFTFVNGPGAVSASQATLANMIAIASAPTAVNVITFAGFTVGSIVATPEPSTTAALAGLVLCGGGVAFRRRRKKGTDKKEAVAA